MSEKDKKAAAGKPEGESSEPEKEKKTAAGGAEPEAGKKAAQSSGADAAKEAPEAEKSHEPTAEEKLAAEKDKYLRLAAEYDNFRKRSAREREAMFNDVRSDTILQLLPVYDNLERALAAATKDEAYRKGVEMTMTQFMEILKRMGVTPIEAVGKKFDASVHNAVMHVEDKDRGAGEIVEEFQKGFTLGGKVIRCSMVKVAN